MGYENEQFAYAAPTGLSCGASCGCQACKTGAVGLGERYVTETDGGAGAREGGVSRFAEAQAPAPPRPSAPPPRAPTPAPQTAAGRLALTRVADAAVPPWRAVCRIVARQDDAGFAVGSGILVSPYHVLTCAHVIFPPQAPNTRQITVFPGQNGPDSGASGFKATGWAVSPRWRRTDCTTDHEDYGIIRLPVQHGFVPPIPFDPADLLAALVMLAGYPGSKEPAARHMYRSRGRVLGAIRVASCTRTTAEGRLVPSIGPADQLIAHDLQTEPSVSGGPMWFTKDTRRLAAIHAGTVANGTVRKAILINDAVRAQIRDWIARTLPPPRKSGAGTRQGVV